MQGLATMRPAASSSEVLIGLQCPLIGVLLMVVTVFANEHSLFHSLRHPVHVGHSDGHVRRYLLLWKGGDRLTDGAAAIGVHLRIDP